MSIPQSGPRSFGSIRLSADTAELLMTSPFHLRIIESGACHPQEVHCNECIESSRRLQSGEAQDLPPEECFLIPHYCAVGCTAKASSGPLY